MGLLPLAKLLAGDGQISLLHLEELPRMHKLPVLKYNDAEIKLEPASIVFDGLRTLSALELFSPVLGKHEY